MTQHNFLTVPSKTTNEVDLLKPLTSYIESVYSNQDDDNKAEISEALQELNKLRSKACCQPLDKHQSALDVLTRYYDQLVAIEGKIIISATQNPVVFKWKDAFDKGSFFSSRASLSMSDGSFERACVLFNCGALMSQIANTQAFITDDEIKTAAKQFQQSAGIFARLRDTVLGMVQQDPTPDLMPDTLAALSSIMLAQAQECIYIKASRDKMKASALVKIAAQAGDFYSEALKNMQKEVVRGLWDKEWTSTINAKSMAFQAAAQYHQAEEDGTQHLIGQQLSRLTEATNLAETAARYLPGVLQESLCGLSKAMAAAKKDNDFIYHERVADFRSLPALPRAALAKALPVTNPLSPRFKDMFVNLVPVQVLNAMQSYKARKSDIVNMESGRLREHTQLMNGILASLNLPAALDDVTSTETLPESIKQKSSKVKQSGGIDRIQQLITELPNLFQRNDEILNETHRMITEEKQSDDNLRRQFGTKWNRLASDQLTTPLVQEVGKYRGILHTASNADKLVRDKFEANRKGIEMLSKSEPELRSAIPGQSPHSVGGPSNAVQKLKTLMDDVQGIKTEREQLEKELKTTDCDLASDFLKAMAESNLINEEQISKEKISQMFEPLKDRVNTSVKRQEHVVAEIETWNTRFVSEKTGAAGGAEREQETERYKNMKDMSKFSIVLKSLATGFDTFNELKGNLEEGTKFYNDLTPILVRLQQKVSDFTFARQTEKEDLMRQLQQNIVTGGAAGSAAPVSTPTSTVPPPRPPPPRPNAPSTAGPTPPTAPPRTVSAGSVEPLGQAAVPMHPTPQMQQVPVSQPQMMMQPQQQQQQQFPGYFQQQVPYGQPQPFQPFYQPQYQPNFANPYPTYPGAYSGYQQPNFGQFPPNPQGQQQAGQQPQQGAKPFFQNQQPPQ